MKFCINCGTELNVDANFCDCCGTAVNTNADRVQKTCTNCGEVLKPDATICPVCNHEVSIRHGESKVHELSLKLEQTSDPEQRMNLIKDFYIPNTKDDICDFFILAKSNMIVGDYDEDAWRAKLEQAYFKAKLTLGNSKEYRFIQELYDEISENAKKQVRIKASTPKGLFLLIMGIALIIAGLMIYPFRLLIFVGIIPFVIGLVMFIVPDNKKTKKKG